METLLMTLMGTNTVLKIVKRVFGVLSLSLVLSMDYDTVLNRCLNF